MMVSEKVTGASSLIRAMSFLQRKHAIMKVGPEEGGGGVTGDFIYRMKNGFQLSCTMMSAVLMKVAPASVSTRLCLPTATLYWRPELLGGTGGAREAGVVRCAATPCAAASYLMQWAAVRTHCSPMSVPPQVCLQLPLLLYCKEI